MVLIIDEVDQTSSQQIFLAFMRRTDVIVDYCGRQYVCELKIWRGKEYHERGEKQLAGYLEDYHLTTGYMVSFNFNKHKETGVRKIMIDGKTIIEAVV